MEERSPVARVPDVVFGLKETQDQRKQYNSCYDISTSSPSSFGSKPALLSFFWQSILASQGVQNWQKSTLSMHSYLAPPNLG